MTAVADFLRRTPLARGMPEGVVWGALADAAVVTAAGAEALAARLALADLSPLPRLGFKGRDTLAAMTRRDIAVEATPNRAVRQPDGGLCLVLGASEVFLLGALDGRDALSTLAASSSIEDGERTYLMPRRDSHAWFAVTGPAAPDLFAKLCGVDLRPRKFADLAVAQTVVARLNAIVVRADRGELLTYHLLADSASAAYLWACLQDAAAEFGGVLVGLDALRQ